MLLRNKSQAPSGGFQYVQAENGKRYSANSYHALLGQIHSVRLANNYPIELDWVANVDTQICKNMDDADRAQWCSSGEQPKPKEGRIGFHEVKQGTITLVDWALHGMKHVEPGEAERRAQLCTGPCNGIGNIPIQECSSCSLTEIRNLIGKIVPAGKKTSVDDKLAVCRYCSCANKAAVWMPLEVLQRHITPEVNESLPSFCWKKRPE